MIWSSPGPPCISSTCSLPKIWSLPAPAAMSTLSSAVYCLIRHAGERDDVGAVAARDVDVGDRGAVRRQERRRVVRDRDVAAASHEIVIASAPAPVTVSTAPATFAWTAAFAMPGSASAAAAATPATGIDFFHLDDTWVLLKLGVRSRGRTTRGPHSRSGHGSASPRRISSSGLLTAGGRLSTCDLRASSTSL